MVTEAGKELLRNTINTAKFHNRILEENEMWKQWELECGLTMMVSDDDILKRIRKNHQCSKHRKRDRSEDKEFFRDRKHKTEVRPQTSAGSSSDRWDHSGFKELYPDEVAAEKSSPASSSHSKKHKKKKRKHHRHSSTSDNEIWEEFKRYKKSKKDKEKLKSISRKSTSSGYDSHVKEWKKLKEKTLLS